MKVKKKPTSMLVHPDLLAAIKVAAKQDRRSMVSFITVKMAEAIGYRGEI